MIRAFRLCKTCYLKTAFSGEGARLSGGRWNSPGLAMVYTSSSLSLATLEVLVHLEDPDAFARLFSRIPLDIPGDLIERLDPATLPNRWCDDETNSSSQAVGDGFPALDGDAITRRLWDQAMHRRQSVKIFNDDARIEQRRAVVHDQCGHFAERIDLAYLRIRAVRIGAFKFEFQLFLGGDNAHFSRERAGGRMEEFHTALFF